MQSIQTRGTVQWFERVFFFALVEKKTIPKSKKWLKPQKSRTGCNICKKPEMLYFSSFSTVFFPTQTKKNCKVGLMKGREENLFVLPRLWKPYLFYHTFWKLKGLFYGTLYHLSLSLVLSLQKIFLICFSEPFSFSTNVLFF